MRGMGGELASDPELVARMAAMVARRDQASALQGRFEASGGSQVSAVDPDARHLHKGGTSVVGYNGQIAVCHYRLYYFKSVLTFHNNIRSSFSALSSVFLLKRV